MKVVLIRAMIVTIFASLIFSSCQKELSCEDCKDGNKPPMANAGNDQTTVLPKDSTLLDGSTSTDADGSIATYKWIKISGPSSPVITKSGASKTPVTSLLMGIYQFELTVTDNGGLSAKDTVQIIVDKPAVNQPPISIAGPDQTITLPAISVILNGSGSTDPDNNITGYAWRKISGPSSFNISNSNAVQTQVISLVQGVYEFELKVTDAVGLFSKDTVHVTVNISDTLSGKEYIINDLTWEFWDDPSEIFDEVYISTPPRSDLFVPLRNMEVFVRLDGTSNWIMVNSGNSGNCIPPYIYSTVETTSLTVFSCPLDLSLVGKKGSIKIKFL